MSVPFQVSDADVRITPLFPVGMIPHMGIPPTSSGVTVAVPAHRGPRPARCLLGAGRSLAPGPLIGSLALDLVDLAAAVDELIAGYLPLPDGTDVLGAHGLMLWLAISGRCR